jgi:hypothetical protein
MRSLILAVACALVSPSAFALNVPAQLAQKTSAQTVSDKLSLILGRQVTNEESMGLEKFKSQVEAMNLEPQKTATFGDWTVKGMACGQATIAWANFKAGGFPCVDFDGNSYLVVTGSASTATFEISAGVTGVLYVGPNNMKPFVGNYGFGGGSIRLPYFLSGAVNVATNLSQQYLALGSLRVGLTGPKAAAQPEGGIVHVVAYDWQKAAVDFYNDVKDKKINPLDPVREFFSGQKN